MENPIRYQILIFQICVVFLFGQEPSWVWPDAPEDPKIRLVGSISDFSNFSVKKSFRKRLADFISAKQAPFLSEPMGLDVLDGDIAIADPGRMGVYLIFQRQKRYFFIDGATVPQSEKFTPIDVAWGKNTIAVTSSSGKGIWLFNSDGSFLRYFEPDHPVGRLTGIAYHNNLFYVADTQNHIILVVNDTGNTVQTIGEWNVEPRQLNYPTFLTVGADNRIYISDTMNFRIAMFDQGGGFLDAIGKRGMATGQLNRPKGIAVDKAGRLYSVDSSFDNFQIFNNTGECLLVVGSAGHGTGELMSPTDIAVSDKYIYVSDTMNKRIQIFEMLYE